MDCSNYLIKFIIIFIQVNLSLNSCDDRALPIFVKSSNKCEMKFCEKEEFEQNICIKDNEIIRLQWLSNIIKFKTKNCRNPKIVKYQNGNIGILTGEQPDSIIHLTNYYLLDEYGKSFYYQIKKSDVVHVKNANGETIPSFDDGEKARVMKIS